MLQMATENATSVTLTDAPASCVIWQRVGSLPKTGNDSYRSWLIERGLAHELGGEVYISCHPVSLFCEIDIPVTALIRKVKRKSNGEPIFAERP